MRFLVSLFLVIALPKHLFAQTPAYPQGYFSNPVRLPILLAGNFGECRPGHFHSGLDIKTGGKEDERVYAAADGYISRIKMEPGGFGHALYVTHPNGYTTLYAHLNNFVAPAQQYLRQQQYARESWTVDLPLSPQQFPVKKGQQIAWSGNTGGSTAPHLHFEIRDTKTEHPLNPQLFGFEIGDNIPPLPKQLAVYDLTLGVNMGARKLVALTKSVSFFRPAQDSITVNGPTAGIGVVADDYMQGSDNTLGIYTAEWYLDDQLQGRIRLADIGYEETRYMHAYVDYGLRKTDNLWAQCLFKVPGSHLDRIYESLKASQGSIQPGDENFHAIRIVLTDVPGNKSEIRFALRCLNGQHMLPCEQPAEPGAAVKMEEGPVSFALDGAALYDKMCLGFSAVTDAKSLSQVVTIGNSTVPVHKYFDLSLKADKPIPFALRNKVAMVYTDDKAKSGKAATAIGQGSYSASVRAFGTYRLLADTTAPEVRALTPLKGPLTKARSISFNVSDALTSVKTFRAELDGKWLLFEQRGDIWTYLMDEHFPKGRHKLSVKATDENGNETNLQYSVIR